MRKIYKKYGLELLDLTWMISSENKGTLGEENKVLIDILSCLREHHIIHYLSQIIKTQNNIIDKFSLEVDVGFIMVYPDLSYVYDSDQSWDAAYEGVDGVDDVGDKAVYSISLPTFDLFEILISKIYYLKLPGEKERLLKKEINSFIKKINENSDTTRSTEFSHFIEFILSFSISKSLDINFSEPNHTFTILKTSKGFFHFTENTTYLYLGNYDYVDHSLVKRLEPNFEIDTPKLGAGFLRNNPFPSLVKCPPV